MGATSKIAIGWIFVIAGGLGTFVLARNSVIGNRKALMEARQRVRDQAEKEGAIQFEKMQQEKESALKQQPQSS